MLSSRCLCLQMWWCSTEPYRKANEFFQKSSIKIHIPHGGVQERKTDRNCTLKKKGGELQDKGGWVGDGEKKEQRGMEDGLIGSWLDFFTTLTVVLCHI